MTPPSVVLTWKPRPIAVIRAEIQRATVPVMHGWGEQYRDLIACYGNGWIDAVYGMTEAETERAARDMRDTTAFALHRARVALLNLGRVMMRSEGAA